jgi:hypothetical protein
MPESCPNCGADLYEGQQFCRRCGVQVGVPAAGGGDAPTQLFPQEARPSQVPAVGTSHVRSEAAAPRLETGPVSRQQPTSYYPPANFQQTSALVGQPFGSQPLAIKTPAPKKRRGAWLFALFIVFVLGAGLALGGAFLWWRATHTSGVKIAKVGPPGAPGVPAVPDLSDMPNVPPDLGDRIKEALKSVGVPLPVDESGATVTGTDTVFTQTYELDGDSAFAVHATSGSVTVTGTDGDSVVVKVTKHGGSPQQREAARVLASKTDEGLTILTAPGQAGGVSVSYEIKVPRELRRLEVSAERGDIKVGEFDGSAVLNLTNGSISVAAAGEVRGRLTNGDINVTYTGRHEDAQEFSVVNGAVKVSFADEPQVDLKAASTNGDIKVEDGLGAGADKRGSGHRLEAELGGGGAPLTLKVVNGDIRLKK